ncbi:MAG: MATE family efflux transporter, partial [Clostridiales bacterium]|nr:MATE family efflux transporter [Clostridiales bacterium]
MEDKNAELILRAPVSKAVITNIIPSIISMIMIMIYNLADTFFLGRTGDALMVAAVSLALPIFMIFMAVGNLFGVGGTSLISRTLGSGDEKRARNISSFCFWTCLVVGLLFMVLLIVFVTPVSRLIGASDDTLLYTTQYLRILAIGLPFLIISGCFSNILRAEGKPRLAMIGTVSGNIINIVLDPIMILGFGWGMTGAAIATVIGNGFAFCFYVVYMVSGKSKLTLNPKEYRAGNGIAKGVFAIGIPSFCSNVLMSVASTLINNLVASYGDLYLAGLGVALKVNSIATTLVMGLGIGVQPLFGYCFGAGAKKRFMEIFRFSMILAFIISIIMTVVCFALAKPLVGAFLSDKEASSYGITFSRIYICSAPIIGMFFVLMNAIQGAGAAIPAFVLSVA